MAATDGFWLKPVEPVGMLRAIRYSVETALVNDDVQRNQTITVGIGDRASELEINA
jgi:hypothetical protein